MEMDKEVLEMLIKTFQLELEELLQVMTNGLLQLEKNDYSTPVIASIFRAAHTIKGGSRSIGANSVGDISHHVESIFSSIEKNKLHITPELTDLCLKAVDSMRSAMLAFIEKKPPLADTQVIIQALKSYEENPDSIHSHELVTPEKTNHTEDNHEHDSIRVSIKNMDSLSDLMERIQINKIAVDDNYLELSKIVSAAKPFSTHWNKSSDHLHEMMNSLQHLQIDMRPHINELEILFNSLQNEIRTLRLVPAGSLLQTFPRLVRDLARDLNKSVELEIKGSDVKIDKNILQGLKDPLIHILRNAVDHGIENADARKIAGKPAIGKISITIQDQGNHILFIIEDDGAGIDYEKISGAAISKKLVSKNSLDQMDRNEILQLIFRQGFSTKASVNDISGRGIGLDIVKSNLSQLSGSVSVSSEPGKNTCFFLRVPLTLSSERGLIVASGGENFILPITHVERALIISREDILEIQATQAIMLDKHPIPLRSLANLLGLADMEPANPGQLSIVVIEDDGNKIALIVDEIINEKEIVIKSMQIPLKNMFCITGGTLSGNGQVILVLNIKDIVAIALNPTQTHHTPVAVDYETEPQTRPHILVVDDSITTRTLEKNILESKKYEVSVAVNGKEAWDLLQRNKFSLLITDVNMPIMDGFALTERVRQSNELRDLPVIIVTSLGSDAEKKRGMEVGANAYIIKNEFESGTLLELVSQLV